jgi:hypothetical protein
MTDNIFMTRDRNYSWGTARVLQDRHSSKWGQLSVMTRLHPGAGAIMSWGLDCSPQVMAAIITPREPWRTKSGIMVNWAPGPVEHTCDRSCSCIPFVPCPNPLSIWSMSVSWRWLKTGWSVDSALPLGSWLLTSFLCLHHASLFGG